MTHEMRGRGRPWSETGYYSRSPSVPRAAPGSEATSGMLAAYVDALRSRQVPHGHVALAQQHDQLRGDFAGGRYRNVHGSCPTVALFPLPTLVSVVLGDP